MIHRFGASVFAPLLLLLVSVTAAQEVSIASARIFLCKGPSKSEKWIGSGKYGLFFSVPQHGFKVLSGTDVDYVKFVIKPNKHKSVLVLWFGYAAFSPHPPSGIIRASATFNQTKLLGPDGIEIGLDSRGKKHNGTTWGWFGVWARVENTKTPPPWRLRFLIKS